MKVGIGALGRAGKKTWSNISREQDVQSTRWCRHVFAKKFASPHPWRTVGTARTRPQWFCRGAGIASSTVIVPETSTPLFYRKHRMLFLYTYRLQSIVPQEALFYELRNKRSNIPRVPFRIGSLTLGAGTKNVICTGGPASVRECPPAIPSPHTTTWPHFHLQNHFCCSISVGGMR